MTTQDSFVVLTQLTYQPELKEKIMHLIYNSMPLYKRQEGLIYIGVHHHLSEPKTMTYFVWESEESYLKCMNSEGFASIAQEWNAMVQSGKAKFEMNTYSVIDAYTQHPETIF
jgi:heme-degrading monooxygenase HmoA